MTDSIIFIVITLIFVGLTFLFNFFGKRIVNNYWFWAVPSLVFLVYFIAIRYWNDWVSFHNYLQTNGSIWMRPVPTLYEDSVVVSKALLLDMCPFVSLALPFSLIVDKSRRLAQTLAPFAILGAGVTIPFIAFSDPSAEISWKYIFAGNDMPIYFFMHFYLMVYGTMVLSNSRNRKWINLLDVHLFAVFYFGYVCFVSYTTNTVWNVTGINENDWMYGEYRAVKDIFHLGWPWVMVVSFSLGYVFIVGIVAINIWWKIKKQKKDPKFINPKFLKKKRNKIKHSLNAR